MDRKSRRRSKTSLLSVAMIQKRLERSTRLLNNLNQIIFPHEKIFTIDSAGNKQNNRVVTFENDVSEHRRVPTTMVTSSLNHDVWRRGIEREADVFDLP